MSNLPDPRRAAFALAVDGIAAALPVPEHTFVGDSDLNGGRLELYVRDNDKASVEQWASFLGLPAPTMILAPMKSSMKAHPTGWFQPYEAKVPNHPVTGYAVIVKSYLTVSAPAGVEAAGGAL